jgi:hypothetical protein
MALFILNQIERPKIYVPTSLYTERLFFSHGDIKDDRFESVQ